MGSQDFELDPRNAELRVYVNGEWCAREDAKVSIFDAGFVVGDGVWEGIRLHHDRLLFLDRHLDRLYWGAQRIALAIGFDRSALTREIQRTLAANDMHHGVHMRVMVTRGVKRAPNQDPRNAIGPATLVIVPEYKEPHPSLQARGLTLATVSIRCTPADMFDMRLNSHSRLNLICALLEAISAGADEALMLDPHGYVSSCNATNFFFVSGGVVKTSRGDHCFHGVTRANVIELCQAHDLPFALGDYTPAEVRAADEAFVTGTFGGLTPVASIDGFRLPEALPGPRTRQLKQLYEQLKGEGAR